MEVHKLLDIASRSSVPVLICGESGTGKEVMARRLHQMSDRANAAFIAHAREDILALLNEVERLRAENEVLGKSLEDLEFFY